MRDFERAKELYFQYDGSRFFMSRDGVEQEYLAFRVPRRLQAKWLEELTEQRLRSLNGPGNWWVLFFLNQHRDYRHLDAVAAADPKGIFWQKCSYLEELCQYIGGCRERYPARRLIEVCKDIQSKARSLRRRVRTQDSISRIEDVIREANETIKMLSR